MLGYLFQVERAVFWLSELKSGGFVGIECGDDLVIKTNVKNGIKFYEQDKSSISKSLPFSDLSKDLWNTLNIWLEKISDEALDLDNSHFFMVSNRKIPNTRLVWKINKAESEEEVTLCLDLLKETGSQHTGKMSDLISSVLNYKDSQIKALFKRIKVFDSSTVKSSIYKEGVRDNMKISKDIPFDNIYWNFLGWTFDSIVTLWGEKKQAWLNVDNFIVLSNSLIKQYLNRPFIEKAIDNLPVSNKDISSHRTENFVKQLEEIDVDEEDKIMAINDYLRASSEKIRFAKEANVTIKDWEEFDRNLIERWNMIFKPVCKLSHQLTEEQKGYEIYYKTLDHKEKLCRVQTEQSYTTKGAYHRLANKIKLGWHPLWKKLFIKMK